MSSGKQRALARARVKNYRRAVRKAKKKGQHPKAGQRHWTPSTMSGLEPMMKFGNGGTDKGFVAKPGVYYSDKPASR